MNKLLFIEKSATLRHALHKLLRKHDYDVDIVSDFESGLTQLADVKSTSLYAGIVLGWPNQTHTSTDELLATLSEPTYAEIPVLVMAHEADSAKLGWVSGRMHTAFLVWDAYEDAIQTLPKLLSQQLAEPCCEPGKSCR